MLFVAYLSFWQNHSLSSYTQQVRQQRINPVNQSSSDNLRKCPGKARPDLFESRDSLSDRFACLCSKNFQWMETVYQSARIHVSGIVQAVFVFALLGRRIFDACLAFVTRVVQQQSTNRNQIRSHLPRFSFTLNSSGSACVMFWNRLVHNFKSRFCNFSMWNFVMLGTFNAHFFRSR